VLVKGILLTSIAVLTAHGVSGQTVRTVRLTTADDVGIFADYYPAATDSAPAVVLIHSIGQNRGTWASVAGLLQSNGIAVVSIDLRGHGDSTRKLTAQGTIFLEHRTFTDRDYRDMLLDVNAAVDWVSEQPDINKQRVGIIGSSLGANLALRYAAINEDLAAVALLSPGINYRGVRTDDVIGQLAHIPVRVFVSRFDAFAYESSKRLIEIRKEAGGAVDDNELIVCSGNVHGTDMLKSVKELPDVLLRWLKRVLSGAGAELPARSK
jgi:dienelactone hydrolase